MTLRVVFMGSPAFAVPSLAALLEGGFDVPLIVTQPDRPVGRRSERRPTAVARLASERGLPVERPEKIRDNADLLARLEGLRPDAIAVVAYGRILPDAILNLPRLGCVNVHASLLPKYRGASPIQAALLNGDAEAGVVTMRIVEALDAGPLYRTARTAIGPRETAGQLSDRLALVGGRLLTETLVGIADGSAVAQPQEGEPSYCKPIRREDAQVDWTQNAAELARRLRAFTPWPGLHTFAGTERVKILEAEEAGGRAPGDPGAFALVDGKLLVSAGAGTALEVRRAQRAGRGPVTGAELARSLPAGRFGAGR